MSFILLKTNKLSAKQFITSFLHRKGAHVLFSFFFNKVTSFLVVIAIVNLLPKSEYGYITYAVSTLGFLLPFMGAGLHQGLVRYGSLSEGQRQKKILAKATMWNALKWSSVFVIVLLLLSPFLTKNIPEASFYLSVLSFQFIGLLLFQFVAVYCRLLGLNRLYAKIENINNVLLVIGNIAMCFLLGGPGYVISMVSIPFIVALFFAFRLGLFSKEVEEERADIDWKEYIIYGLSVSIGGVLSQLLYSVDILLLGNMLENSEELIAQYKVATIFPFSLLFIPVAIVTTDFVKLARAAETDKAFIKNYYWNYLKLFSGVAALIFAFFWFFGESLLALFGKDYQQVPELMVIFAVGIVGGLLFRVPLGNILSAIGWPKINAVFSAIIVMLNVVGSYFMIQWYGIIGAAIVTASLMWLSGLLSLGALLWFLKK
ncbi:MAG: polysaccharide biosynthesis C-terminal domain-containing protein [Saprospiraceae bacterium]